MTEIFTTNFLKHEDRKEWSMLFEGYGEFYKVSIDDLTIEKVWSWILDPEHVMEGLITRNSKGTAVGIAHFRACPRTLAGCELGFLDDLFVCPEHRGTGAADAVFHRLKQIASERNWKTFRWITQSFNTAGRKFYDRYTSGPSDFIMYQWNLEP